MSNSSFKGHWHRPAGSKIVKRHMRLRWEDGIRDEIDQAVRVFKRLVRKKSKLAPKLAFRLRNLLARALPAPSRWGGTASGAAAQLRHIITTGRRPAAQRRT